MFGSMANDAMTIMTKQRSPANSFPFRHRVVYGVFAPGMTAQDAFDGHPGTPEDTPFLDSLDGVSGAGWPVTAFARPQQRRQGILVDADGEDQELFEQPHGWKS